MYVMKGIRYIMLLIALVLLPAGSGWTDMYAQKRTNTKTTTTKSKAAPAKKKIDKKTQLRNEKAAVAKARKLQQQKAAQLNKNIRNNLDSVMILDNRIGHQRMSIDSLNREIDTLRSRITRLQEELDTLQANLEMRKQHYAKGLVHMRRNRSLQNKMMFVFSASNFSQLTRRFRYLREYNTFQRAQAEIIREQQKIIEKKKVEMEEAKVRMEANRQKMLNQKKMMEQLKYSCQIKVNFLNKNLLNVNQQIKILQKKEASLDAAIERAIQEEVEAARRAQQAREQRAREEEARRKANAQERARKLSDAKSAQERARRNLEEAEAKRKAAEAASRAAKTEAEKAAAKEAENRARAEEERARAEVKAAESGAKAAEKEQKSGDKADRKASKDVSWVSNESDVKLSSSFVNNKGRLPMPVTGGYNIARPFGIYSPPGLKGVVLNNKGIDIRTQPGASARAVFNGVVSKVFQYSGRYIVMVRHGSYLSVYSGLSSVRVSAGQSVSTKDTLGSIGTNEDGNYVLHFQLRKESSLLNPASWVR